MEFEPLNPLLFRRLQAIFGRVRVSGAGEAMSAQYVDDPVSGRERLIINYPGEYYMTCCDKCSDTRFRLYINHRWGVRDDHGRLNLWLAVCYNENCYAGYDAAQALYDKVTDIDRPSFERARIRPGVEVDTSKPMELPGPCIPLHQLPKDHRANRYLAGRFYDPEYLGRVYGVSFCTNSVFYLARDRIVIPILNDGVLVGWQARYVGELDWKKEHIPKYFNPPGMHRGRILYNLDRAKGYCTGVGMEGPMDVLAFGPMGVGSLGFPLTAYQLRTIVQTWKDGSFVLLVDPDIFTKPRTKAQLDEMTEQLAGRFAHGLAVVRLPGNYDPGDLDPQYMREYVTAEARAQGVKVRWCRKP